ncbi:endoplasmic reticulum lectin 1-like isoform X2 [Patiria miniata]|nr:endoplasmic reticulum lectin 1-like isoform X2 [Patiria miniata]XP_038072355.1 endoplasmic reticulum lectin 1-like isoform X2 [Patiria miniata]XP_038072356.1 endoplasmic reticulum lectin 1-like isoform X2 [Patiria miniata]
MRFQGPSRMSATAMIWPRVELLTLSMLLSLQITHSDFLNSNSLFKLNWAGSIQDLTGNSDYLIMTTPNNEKYQCVLPDEESQKRQNEVNYPGPSAAELMQPVFTKGICTIRIETYWNFELCHGKHVRQYHEEKETGKETKLLEFYLGKNMKSPGGKEYELQTISSLKGTYDDFKVPTITIDGKEIPYYEVLMDDGTPCDLRGDSPRLTRVRYICEGTGRNEMLTIKETSTCEYEAVILTPYLCSHPLYKFREPPINAINCHAMNGAPARPLGYEQLYKDTSSRLQFSAPKAKSSISKGSASTEEGEKSTQAAAKQALPRPVLIDKQILRDFLNGDYCLHGGQGWWKYEFCYGKFAQQYHTDTKTGTTVILLGSWNKQEHIAWWTQHQKTVGSKSVTHYYGNGDICDLTGKPRVAQVKLKCKADMQATAVTIYLSEPRDCEYVLGVDSPIICSLLETADEYGILHPSTSMEESADESTEKP